MDKEDKEEIMPIKVEIVKEEVKPEEFEDAPEYHKWKLTKEEMEDEQLEF